MPIHGDQASLFTLTYFDYFIVRRSFQMLAVNSYGLMACFL